jgi:RNA polymerase sigma factor (sigma-70 family)
MPEENDAALVRRARQGDKRAFGELITRHQQMVHRVAQHMVRDEELARDLAQEALLAAYLSLDQLRDVERFASWLYGITLNVCRSQLRSSNISPLSFEEIAGGVIFERVGFSSEPDPQSIAEARELHERVLGAVNALSKENRAATLLFYYDGLTLAETAMALGISVGAVKGRLHKSRRQLREELFDSYVQQAPGALQSERTQNMIPVTVADVVQNELRDLEGNPVPYLVVVLTDANRERALPIWVGQFEGNSIAMGMTGEPVQRPMTFEFMAKLLAAANAQVQEVRIDALKEDVYYAVVTVNAEGKKIEVDARPSDAIALAVRMGRPIYVAEAVFERTGITVPKPAAVHSPPRGVEQILEGWRKASQAGSRLAKRTEEETQRSQNELLELVFGSE